MHASKFGQDQINKARPWLALLNQTLLEAVIWGNELLPSSLISSSLDSIANLARLSLPDSQTKPIRGIDFNYILEIIKREATNSDFDSLKLASVLNVSKRTLFRIFKEADVSFEALRLRARLHHAELLLRHGDQNNSVEYIAYKTGFKSVSHFHEKFRAMHFCTPNEYRKQMVQPISD